MPMCNNIILIALFVSIILSCKANVFNLRFNTPIIISMSDKEKSSSRQKQIANFISGGISGTISCTITAPLEVVICKMIFSILIYDYNATGDQNSTTIEHYRSSIKPSESDSNGSSPEYFANRRSPGTIQRIKAASCWDYTDQIHIFLGILFLEEHVSKASAGMWYREPCKSSY